MLKSVKKSYLVSAAVLGLALAGVHPINSHASHIQNQNNNQNQNQTENVQKSAASATKAQQPAKQHHIRTYRLIDVQIPNVDDEPLNGDVQQPVKLAIHRHHHLHRAVQQAPQNHINNNHATQPKQAAAVNNSVKPIVRHHRHHRHHVMNGAKFNKPASNMEATTTKAKPVKQNHQRHVNQAAKSGLSMIVTPHHHHHSWFKDGLSSADLSARNWVSYHESGHNWNILSYGGRCIGYFQLDPAYLGYKNGHINLDHKHQVKIADHYALTRYGSWVNAKEFWEIHHWY